MYGGAHHGKLARRHRYARTSPHRTVGEFTCAHECGACGRSPTHTLPNQQHAVSWVHVHGAGALGLAVATAARISALATIVDKRLCAKQVAQLAMARKVLEQSPECVEVENPGSEG